MNDTEKYIDGAEFIKSIVQHVVRGTTDIGKNFQDAGGADRDYSSLFAVAYNPYQLYIISWICYYNNIKFYLCVDIPRKDPPCVLIRIRAPEHVFNSIIDLVDETEAALKKPFEQILGVPIDNDRVERGDLK